MSVGIWFSVVKIILLSLSVQGEELEEEEQSFKLALVQPCVWSVSDFILLASSYGGGGQSSPSQSHLPTDSVWSVYYHSWVG